MEFLIQVRLWVFFVGFVGFATSERYLTSYDLHWVFTGVSLGLMALGSVLPILAANRAKAAGKLGEANSWWIVLLWQILFVLGAGLYLAYSQVMGNKANPETLAEKALLAGWLLAYVVGIFTAVGTEISHASSGKGDRAEPKRVQRGALNWGLIGVLLGVLVCFNFAVAKKDKAWDWSYLKTTTPSASTVAIASSTKLKLEIAIFYAQDNEVLPFVKEYFDYLAANGGNIDLNYYDQNRHPTKAEEFKASRNGQIIFRIEERRERIDVGKTLKSARSMLKKLDGEVQKVVLRLTQERKRIYFSRGHGEMSWIGKKDPLRSIGLLEKVLRSQNYSLRLFGLAEGSGTEVPEDAAAVIVAGPTSAFQQSEADALEAYLNRGGKLFVLMDVAKSLQDTTVLETTAEDPLQKLLAKTGLTFRKETLANEKNYVSATRSPVDRWFLFSNSFSTHASISKLARNEERVAIMMFQAGHFEVKARSDKWRAYATVRSMPNTFVDANRNYAKDNGENSATFSLGGAAVMPTDAEDENMKEAKILVLGDANALSDALIRNRGNAIYALDSLRWLAGQSEFSGETSNEEDVKIRHTREEDAIWFNATVLVMPLLILAFGFVATRKRKLKGDSHA